jgi:uncharacterized membrane protein YcaP (DUF421 family)
VSDILIPLEIWARVAFVYGLLLIVLRVIGRREMKQITPMDLLAMLLVTRAIGESAMVGAHKDMWWETFAAASLLCMAWLVGHVAFRWRRAEIVINGRTQDLIDRGRVADDVLRRNEITDADLRRALHKHGLTGVEDVAHAWLEPDGEITIVSFTDLADAQEHRPRRQSA